MESRHARIGGNRIAAHGFGPRTQSASSLRGLRDGIGGRISSMAGAGRPLADLMAGTIDVRPRKAYVAPATM